MAHLLIVDDEPAITKSLGTFFERNGGHVVTRAHSGAEGVQRFVQDRPDLMLLDLSMPDITGFEVLDQIRSYDPVVIVITGNGEVPIAVQAMKKGAENFIQKPLDLPVISHATELALERVRQKRLSKIATNDSSQNLSTESLGSSPAMRELADQIHQLARIDESPALLLGESGTGKGRVAVLVHQLSSRSANPLVVANCAIHDPKALELELFGFERGAFDGALDTHPGKLELAAGGSLFLDEIAELPAYLQAKILEILDGKGHLRLGGTARINSNVRLITATSKDLVGEVSAGRFREDLYYRLSSNFAQIPPLRARSQDDVFSLIDNLLEELVSYVTDGPSQLSDEASEFLLMYSWPGNVRELRNVLERAMLAARGSDIILPDHLPMEVRTAWGGDSDGVTSTLMDVERAHIHRILRASKLNRTQAARALGISRATLVKKIKQFGLLAKGTN